MLTNAQLIKRLIEGTELSVIKNSFKIDSCSTKLNIDSECLSVFTAFYSTSLNFDSECRTLFNAFEDPLTTRNLCCQHPPTNWVAVQLIWTLIPNAEHCSPQWKIHSGLWIGVLNTLPQIEPLSIQSELWLRTLNVIQRIESSTKDMQLALTNTHPVIVSLFNQLEHGLRMPNIVHRIERSIQDKERCDKHPSTIWVAVQSIWTLTLNAEQCSKHWKIH